MKIITNDLPKDKQSCLFSEPLNISMCDANGCYTCMFKSSKNEEDIFCDGANECQFLATFGDTIGNYISAQLDKLTEGNNDN